jgi:hypothetical protein
MEHLSTLLELEVARHLPCVVEAGLWECNWKRVSMGKGRCMEETVAPGVARVLFHAVCGLQKFEAFARALKRGQVLTPGPLLDGKQLQLRDRILFYPDVTLPVYDLSPDALVSASRISMKNDNLDPVEAAWIQECCEEPCTSAAARFLEQQVGHRVSRMTRHKDPYSGHPVLRHGTWAIRIMDVRWIMQTADLVRSPYGMGYSWGTVFYHNAAVAFAVADEFLETLFRCIGKPEKRLLDPDLWNTLLSNPPLDISHPELTRLLCMCVTAPDVHNALDYVMPEFALSKPLWCPVTELYLKELGLLMGPRGLFVSCPHCPISEIFYVAWLTISQSNPHRTPLAIHVSVLFSMNL